MENQPQNCPSTCCQAEDKQQNPYRKWKTYKTGTSPKFTITGYSRAADKVTISVIGLS
jgi:hypothetical protein